MMVQKFEEERARLTELNDAKISALEEQVGFLQKEKEVTHQSVTRDYEETIKCLKEHVKTLERTNF